MERNQKRKKKAYRRNEKHIMGKKKEKEMNTRKRYRE